jgi:hypothetical protein
MYGRIISAANDTQADSMKCKLTLQGKLMKNGVGVTIDI